MSHTVNQSWAPNYLIEFYFQQDEAWITAKGESLNVEDMDREHALNSILMVERVRTQIEPFLKCRVWETPLYAALKAHVLGNPSVVTEEQANAPEDARFVVDYGEGSDIRTCYLRAAPSRREDRPLAASYPYSAPGWCPDTGKPEADLLLSEYEVETLRPL